MHSPAPQLEIDTQNFFIQWRGKVNLFPTIPGECVCVIKQFFQDVLKIPPFHGNALDYLNGVPGFTLHHPNGDKPAFGDIVIFSFNHIGITAWTSASFLNCFQQNDPIGSKCDFKTYDYAHIAGWLHWNGSQKTVLNYTVYNGSPDLMEQARQLLLKYGKGRFDATFDFRTAPQQKQGIFTTDEQVIFLQAHINAPFVFLFYDSGIPNYGQIATAQVPQTNVIMSCATPHTQSPLNIVYEMANTLSLVQGKFLPPDLYVPDETFVQKRFDLLT